MAKEPRPGRQRLDRQHVERKPLQDPTLQCEQCGVDVDHRATRGIDEIRARFHHAQQRYAHHVSRFHVERHVQRHDVALSEGFGQRDPLDVCGEIAVDNVRIARDYPLEHIAADMRHALADSPEPDDAQRHVAGAAQFPRRKVMPLPRIDVAMVGNDVAIIANASANACVATSPTP
jgi:hypothetical protein